MSNTITPTVFYRTLNGALISPMKTILNKTIFLTGRQV